MNQLQQQQRQALTSATKTGVQSHSASQPRRVASNKGQGVIPIPMHDNMDLLHSLYSCMPAVKIPPKDLIFNSQSLALSSQFQSGSTKDAQRRKKPKSKKPQAISRHDVVRMQDSAQKNTVVVPHLTEAAVLHAQDRKHPPTLLVSNDRQQQLNEEPQLEQSPQQDKSSKLDEASTEDQPLVTPARTGSKRRQQLNEINAENNASSNSRKLGKKRDTSSATMSNQTYQRAYRQKLMKPVRAPSSPIIVTKQNKQSITKQDFYPQNQDEKTNQGVVEDEPVIEVRTSAMKTYSVLPAIPNLEAQSKTLTLSNSSQHTVKQLSLRGSFSERTSMMPPTPYNQCDQSSILDVSVVQEKSEIRRTIKRAASRSKILSPLVNPPTLQPVDNAQLKELSQISVINTLITLEQKHQPLVMASPTNGGTSIKLKPLNTISSFKNIMTATTIELPLVPVTQEQITVPASGNDLKEDKSPMRPRNPQNQTLTNFEVGTQHIYCQTLNAEPFIRRAVQKLGWVEVPQTQNRPGGFFHVRFNISDLEGSTLDLKPWQFYNHHPSNREITTKAGLCKNLWQSCFDEYQLQVSSFFPRCYDLADVKQMSDFVNDFNQTACLSIIKIMSKHYVLKNPQLQNLYLEYQQKVQQFTCPQVYKKQFKIKCQSLDPSSTKQVKSLASMDLLRFAYYFAKGYLQTYQYQEQAKNSKPKQPLKQQKKPQKQIEDLASQIYEYHRSLIEKGVNSGELLPTYEQFKIL